MLIIETVINRYLALDPEMLEKMSGFSGKVIKMEITGISKQLFIFPDASGIHITSEFDGQADTLLRGSPLSLFKMGLAANAANLLLKGEVEISGDTGLGHRFKNLFSQMDIDWSEPLADWFGDSIAYQLQQTGKKFGLWSKRSVQSVSMTLSEYLQEESRDVVTETEIQMFNDSVSRLRDDADRLQAKMAKLSTATTTE